MKKPATYLCVAESKDSDNTGGALNGGMFSIFSSIDLRHEENVSVLRQFEQPGNNSSRFVKDLNPAPS